MDRQAQRPTPLRPSLLGVGFFLAASATIGLTRFDGGVSILWIATSLLLGWLATAPAEIHRRGIVSCCVASLAVTAFVGLGPLAAPFLIPANVGEAVLGAWLLRRWLGHASYFESTAGIVAFVVVAGLLAPAAGAVPGAFMVYVVTGRPFLMDYAYWFVGHGLGTVAFTPIVMLVLRGEVRSWAKERSYNLIEPIVLLVGVAATTAYVFLQSSMPLLFLPMLPMMIATIRLGRFGAAMSTVIVCIGGGLLTLHGTGPIHLMTGDVASKAQFFQLYVATAVLLVLPVAALLKQNRELLIRLSQSEARHNLIERHSSDAILNIAVDGTILYASPAVRTLGGFDPDALVGQNALGLVHEEYQLTVMAGHSEALESPERTICVEYRAPTSDGSLKWFESNTRAAVAEDGALVGVVSAIRDVSHRKAAESRLKDAANTDVLTGLLNRRAFLEMLETRWQQVCAGEGICSLAIFDIDRFKAVNDLYGHAVGDLALRTFADTVRSTLRGADMIARIGGEEFALLLWNADVDAAAVVAERLRGEVAKTPIRSSSGHCFSITVSVGVAELLASADASVAMNAADEALYSAKGAGRNCLRLVS